MENQNTMPVEVKRGPGRQRKNFTKTFTFRVVGDRLVPRSKGKPSRVYKYTTRELPYNWVPREIGVNENVS